MSKISKHRIIKSIIALIFIVGFSTVFEIVIYDRSLVTGWSLFLLVAMLILYNFRKMLLFLPIGSNKLWLQVHLYTGIVAIFVFFEHLNWRMVNGLLETLLAAVFMLICISGITGILLSRLFAKYAASSNEQLLYNRIPVLSNTIRDEAFELIQNSVEVSQSTTLSDVYIQSLFSFFESPNNVFISLFGKKFEFKQLVDELKHQERYMNSQEIMYSQQLQELLERKDLLDHQYSTQKVLKSWLFFHIPLSYSLLILLFMHIILVYGFGTI